MNHSETVSIYEPCPKCTDGTCRECGTSSSDHAGPGVRLVIRRVQFTRCLIDHSVYSPGFECTACGPRIHPMAAYGITIKVVREHTTTRWVPAMHFSVEGRAGCKTPRLPVDRLTTNRADVTCTKRGCV